MLPDSVQMGQRLSITCTVIKGDAPIVIRWLKDGVLLRHHAHHSSSSSMPQSLSSSSSHLDSTFAAFKSAEDQEASLSERLNLKIHRLAEYSSTLLFPAVRSDHRGNYSCSVHNDVGSDTHTASLVILGQTRSLSCRLLVLFPLHSHADARTLCCCPLPAIRASTFP